MSARRFVAAEGGQAIVIIALAMTTLLLGVGLAIDTGTLFIARRSAQSAADSAAWAGAVVLYRGGTASAATTAATADATKNGFTNGVSSTTVSVVTPPASGEWAGDTRFVELTITRDVRTVFLQGAAAALTKVQVRAVAGAAPTMRGYAILVLGSGTALDASGGADLVVSGGSIQVNSSDSSGVKTTGTSAITVTGPSDSIGVVGGYSGSGFSPTPTTGVAAAFDPFLAMPEPNATTCAGYGGCATVRATGLTVTGPLTISPGIYVRGIAVRAAGVLTMQSGIYIMQDGGFEVAGGGSVVGNGVMIFNTVADYPASTGDCDGISIAGGSALTLSAPTTGVYKGMLMWQDKDCGTLPADALTITGATALTALSGTFYVPNNSVNVSGTAAATVNINTQIIASKLSVSGTADINLKYDESLTAQPLRPALVE